MINYFFAAIQTGACLFALWICYRMYQNDCEVRKYKEKELGEHKCE